MLKYIVLGVIVAGFATLGVVLDAQTTGDTLVLSDNNTVILNSAIFETTARDAQLALMDRAHRLPKKAPIYLFLNTPGGSVLDGGNIIETAKGLPNPIHTVSKFAASMGFNLVQALDTRYMLNTGVLMQHRMTISGLSGQVPGSAGTRLGSIYEEAQRIDNVSAKRAKMDVLAFQNLTANEMWLSSFQAIAMRFADQRVAVRCDDSLLGSYTVNFDTIFGTAKVEFSKCPLIEPPLSIKFAGDNKEEREAILLMLYNREAYYHNYIETGLHQRLFR